MTRIRPEICAKIECPLSKTTLKVVLGKDSSTTPSNLTNSLLFAMFYLENKKIDGEFLRSLPQKNKINPSSCISRIPSIKR